LSEERKKPITQEEAHEVGPLYAVGGLDHISARAFERRLETSDDDVVHEVAAWKATAAELPLTLDPVAPHPQLKAKLLDRIAAEKSSAAASSRQEKSSTGKSWSYLLPIAAAVLLAITSVVLYRRTVALQNEVSRLTVDLHAKERDLLAQKTEFDQLLARSGQMVSLAGGDASPQASAKLFWDKKRQQWVIFFFNLPGAPSDKQYQFWYITKDQRKISAAVLKPADLSQGKLTLELPADIASNIAAAGLTLEPAGGSPQPTGQLYVVGSV
jgi:anti-sigma-K factor RskA